MPPRANKSAKKVAAAESVQLSLFSSPHRNQQLFSDHYLDVILPARSDWQVLLTEAEAAQADLRTLFAGYTPSTKEAQVEEELIKPILKRLGHTFEVQPSLKTPDGTKTPDYVLYCDQTALVENKNKVLTDKILEHHAIAVGDAKYWDRPLDVSLKQSGGDPFTNKNPSYQIAFYMQHGGLDWGILTNGRLWRLYHKETAHKLDRFYEINLPELLETKNISHFLYFYAFFRRQAFDLNEALNIEGLRQASVDYARGVSDSLKAQVYEALRHVAQGFLDYRPNKLQPDPQTLQAIYNNSLILLYRLLFVFYAEARELLPVHQNAGYGQSYSLDSIRKTIQQNLKTQKQLLPGTATLWAQLTALFTIINEGNETLDVSTFNGGLFNPKYHPFLEQYTVGDLHLQLAIDKLARVDGQFVDYRDLAERHLGTIYEGLLEFHLQVADPPEKGWTIDLRTAKGERKATGSYYTPEYIVKYIVEETLGPILRKAVKPEQSEQEKIQAVLNVKVLDPAMGSGHFPVEATEYIARFLVEHTDQSLTETGGESELAYWRRRVAQSCIYGVDANPLAVDLAKLSLWLVTIAKDRPLSFLDHHLRCGNSLIGARLDELKVKPVMAKKSTKKSHLVPMGNGEVAQPALFDEDSLRQAMTTAVDLMRSIEGHSSQTLTDIQEQEKLYEDLRQQLSNKYATLANLVSAQHFGMNIDSTLWPSLSTYATGGMGIAAMPAQFGVWFSEANRTAETRGFFHWELEFPEVFFSRQGQPLGLEAGFDAVIGNPPYVRQEELGPFKPYFAVRYPETYDGVADLYVYFYQQGLRLTRAGGRMSYIVTNKWMRAGYGQSLRAFFSQEGALKQIIDFGHAPIFDNVEVFPCILVLEKPQTQEKQDPLSERQVQVLTFPREELQYVLQRKQSLNGYIREHSYGIPMSRFTRAAWHLEGVEVNNLLTKISRVGVPLAEFAGVKPLYGIKTGLNEAFLIDTPTKERLIYSDPHSAAIIKPYLRGQDIKRWLPESAGLWIIVLKSSSDYTWPWSNTVDVAEAEKLFQQAFPALYNHMKPLEAKLRNRQDQGRYWWELRPCAYYDIFDRPKIITQDLATYSWFCIDNQGFYPVNTCYVWPTSDLYILGWLCSPLTWWVCHHTLQHSINDTLRMFGEQVQNLPIALPTTAIRAETETIVTKIIEATRVGQDTQRLLLDWLRTEFDVHEPGKRLENFAALDFQVFVEEVRKRRPGSAKKLTPNALKALQEGYNEQLVPCQRHTAEVVALEQELSRLVNRAYGLTPEEVKLLWATAPPRMPLAAPNSSFVELAR